MSGSYILKSVEIVFCLELNCCATQIQPLLTLHKLENLPFCSELAEHIKKTASDERKRKAKRRAKD